MIKEHFISPFSLDHFPAWHCPSCNKGVFIIDEKKITTEETAASQKARQHEDWDPTWIKDRFIIKLFCSICREPAIIIGDTKYDYIYRSFDIEPFFFPKYLNPVILPIHIDERCPEQVKDELVSAAEIYWCSPSGCGNKLRNAVERMMDCKKVRKYKLTGKGKREPQNLHARIKEFSQKNKDLGSLLLAIKWLGNTASHTNQLNQKDVLNAFEVLEYVIDELFGGKSQRIMKYANTVNKSKGKKLIT
jgi:hypothetical protein